ncbi:B-cell receptor CD22-like [Megalops cyprinoides]|uniref:B-cell receptor CD22-like n=1 Tax=Megalops cyprinoides TaxID=118141 RepID=UPI0018645236|nr:B-cell receptor CD22-like [Megalops cyprinoides]
MTDDDDDDEDDDALQASVNPGTVTEGQRVTLTCSTSCPLSGSPAFIWYRNGHPLPNSTQNVQFSASSEDAGSYSCAVRGYKDLSSSAVALSVRYAPKNTSVSISPSGEIMEGSSVTLTCSSNANPPVQSYTWFKNDTAVSTGSGQSYSITNISSEDSGQYHCEAMNQISSSRSPPLNVNVQYSPKNTYVSISPSGEIVEGSSVTLTCSSNANPPVQNYTWFKDNRVIASVRGSGRSYSITNISSEDSGQYYCEAKNKHGAQNSPAVPIDVQYGPQSTSVSVSPSGEIVEGSSVTLTCSSNANPPVQSYTWFKHNTGVTSVRGSGQNYTISNLRSEDSGQYYCEDNTCSTHANVSEATSAQAVTQRRPSEQDEAQYENVQPPRSNDQQEILYTTLKLPPSQNQQAVRHGNIQRQSGNQQEILYATVKVPPSHNQEEVQYACIQFPLSSAATRSSAVFYSARLLRAEIFSTWIDAVMLVKTICTIVVVLHLSVQGALAEGGWDVTYTSENICALKGTSVEMACTYTYPSSYTINTTFWCKDCTQWIGENPVDLASTPEYKGRVEYLGDMKQNSTLRLKNLTASDSGGYYFRFITNTQGGKWLGAGGSQISVTALQASVNPDTVTEGKRVKLNCSTTCTLSGSPAFIWNRNGHPLSFTNQSLTFSASSEDAGSYSCAVRGYEHLSSSAVTLSVTYAPKNTSASVSPSGEIVEGSSVTLTCSSNANPPVHNYTWFKKNETGVWQTGSHLLSQTALSDSNQEKPLLRQEESAAGQLYRFALVACD